MKLIILIACLIFGIYAIKCEQKNAQHAYEWGNPIDTDSLPLLLKKAEWCMTYEDRTIKWRRSFLIAFVCTLLISAIQQRVPLPNEFFLNFIIIYVGYSIMWYSYVSNVAEKSVLLGKKCLRKIIKKNS